MKRQTLIAVFAVGLCLAGLTSVTWAEPRQWKDDFTTAATYDSDSLFAPCNSGPPTKYTSFEILSNDIYNHRAVSGGGSLRCTALNMDGGIGYGRLDIYILGWMGAGINCPGEPASKVTSEPFTSTNVCIYGGFMWNNWQMCDGERDNGTLQDWVYGLDAKPGFANVDDDNDGTTDEVGTGWPDTGEYPGPGPDGQPGVAGVDDDGINGVDDIGEQKWPGSDDSDDESGKIGRNVGMKLNLAALNLIHLNFGPNQYSGGGNIFSIRQWLAGVDTVVIHADEIMYGFFKAGKHYNYSFCVSGTVYGAMLWTGPDMSNPAETLGPMTNSSHTSTDDNGVYMTAAMKSDQWSIENPAKVPYENITYLGNSNFSDAFWVISGSSNYPSPSADLDGDKDVDGFDFLTFSNCYNGSNRAPLAACVNLRADLDEDSDVDGFDFLTFSNCYNGSNRRPLAACLPTNVAGGTPPVNDTCAGAITIGDGATIGAVSGVCTLSYSHSCVAGPAVDVWYKYVPTCTGTATISTCDTSGLTGKVLPAAALAVYTACPPSGSQLTCTDSASCGTGDLETVGVPVTSGTPVYIAVIANHANAWDRTGNFKLTVSCAP